MFCIFVYVLFFPLFSKSYESHSNHLTFCLSCEQKSGEITLEIAAIGPKSFPGFFLFPWAGETLGLRLLKALFEKKEMKI